MNILVVANSRSGRGKADSAADSIVETLRTRGHDVQLLSLDAPLDGAVDASDAVIVVGGDGTLHAVVDTCVEAGTPVYHAPAGTENLFAREFGMTARASAVADALERGPRKSIDVAHVLGKAFVVMASVGFDASVIHRLDQRRNGSISHLHYARPIWHAFIRFPLPHLSIEVDGRAVVERSTGLAVVANSRQYAMRLDPARRAKPDDGLLDIVFLPYRGRLGLLRWLLLALAGVHLSDEHVVFERGRSVRIATDAGEAALQLDGEAVRAPDDALEFSIEPASLEVVLPLHAE